MNFKNNATLMSEYVALLSFDCCYMHEHDKGNKMNKTNTFSVIFTETLKNNNIDNALQFLGTLQHFYLIHS